MPRCWRTDYYCHIDKRIACVITLGGSILMDIKESADCAVLWRRVPELGVSGSLNILPSEITWKESAYSSFWQPWFESIHYVGSLRNFAFGPPPPPPAHGTNFRDHFFILSFPLSITELFNSISILEWVKLIRPISFLWKPSECSTESSMLLFIPWPLNHYVQFSFWCLHHIQHVSSNKMYLAF